MCKTCAYDTIVAGKSTKKYSWSSGGKVKYEITCAKSGSAGVSCAGENNDNGGRPRYSATCWWYQYYSNGHFNCAKFNSPVTVSESKWENTHGRPEEVCVPSAPAIDVTQHLAAYKAASAGKMKATKAATKASQCASD